MIVSPKELNTLKEGNSVCGDVMRGRKVWHLLLRAQKVTNEED